METHAQIAGSAEWKHGPGSYDVGMPFPGHSLPAAADELEWAIYRMPTGGYPVLRFHVGLFVQYGGAYIGVANFAKGNWDFYGESTGISYSQTIGAQHVSPTDFIYVAVAAYDVSGVIVTSFSLVTDEPGWNRTTVYDTPSGGTLALFADGADGLPRIASLTTDSVQLFSANSTAPTGSGSWEHHVVDTPGTDLQFRRPLRGEFINGKPALAYFEGDSGYDLTYAYASTATPSAMANWTTVVVDHVTLPDSGMGFCEFDRHPRIMFKDSFGDDISLATADTAIPGAPDWDIYLAAADASRPSLTVINGRLACAFLTNSVDFYAHYIHALTDDPTAVSDWSTPTSFGWFPGNFGNMSGLCAVPLGEAEAPSLAFCGQSSVFYVLAANVSEPAISGDWNSNYMGSGHDIGAQQFDIAEVDGRPAVAYFLTDVNWLQMAWAKVAQPDGSDDWVVETVEAGHAIGSISLASVDDKPAIAYFDADADAIMYACID